MSLTVVAGLPGAGAGDRIVREMGCAARDGRSALLVLPSGTAVESSRAALARDVTLGVRVATLDGALQREWALHGDGRALVTSAQRDIFAKRCLLEARVADDPGRGAVSMLAALAQRHAAAGSPDPGTRPGLSGRILEALRLYRASLQRCGLVEPAESARMLAEWAPPAEVIGAAGFAGLRPEQEGVIVGWASSADVLVEVPWAAGVGATEGLTALVERLVAHGGVLEAVAPDMDPVPPELRRIRTSLFTSDHPQAASGAVRLGLARGDEGEAALIASMARDLIVAGERPADIVVAFPDAARHAGWAAHELRAAGVPVRVDVPVPAAQTPFGRALIAIWGASGESVPGAATISFLRTPFAGAPVPVTDRVDLLVRERRTGRAAAEVSHLGATKRLIDACRRLSRAPVDSRTAEQWKELADSLLSNAYPGDAPVLADDAAQDAAAHRLFCRTVEELAALGEGSVGAGDLLETFRAASVRPRPQPLAEPGEEGPGAVLVTTLGGLRDAQPRNAIIGGLTAGEVPGRGAAERLEGGAVSGAMTALGVEIGPDEQGAAERLAFYLSVAAPTHSLALTRRESDDEGRALRESVFWDEFLDLYRAPDAEGVESGPELERSSEAETRRCGAVRARGDLVDSDALAELASIETVSPSQVELYLRCPYRWFVTRRLKPESPDERIDARLEGTLAHDALATFYRNIGAIGVRVTPANLPRALELAAEAVGEVTAGAPRAEDLVSAQLLADVGPAVARTITADATFLPDYTPALHEWSFGPGQDEPAIDLGGVTLKGRTDRIDVGPDGLIVVDYKLSKVTPVAKFADEHLVQLQLYAAAASRKLGVPVAGGLYRGLRNGKVRGFVLEGVEGSFTSTDRRNREEIDGLVDAAVDAARTAFDGMRSGGIQPTPSKDVCASCPAASFCTEAVG